MTNECPICEGTAETRREFREITVQGRTVSAEHEFIWCEECQEEFYTPEMMDAVLSRAADVIRRAERAIPAAQIFALRNRLGYSQAEFETILGTGPKTVTRWERGLIVPGGAANTLLRIFLDDPEWAHRIAREKGITQPLRAPIGTQAIYANRVRTPFRVAETLDMYGYVNSLSSLLQDLEADASGEGSPSLPFEGPRWFLSGHGAPFEPVH